MILKFWYRIRYSRYDNFNAFFLVHNINHAYEHWTVRSPFGSYLLEVEAPRPEAIKRHVDPRVAGDDVLLHGKDGRLVEGDPRHLGEKVEYFLGENIEPFDL